MACAILSDAQHAAFYCTTSGHAFGPVMADQEEAEDFRAWVLSGAAVQIAPTLGITAFHGDGRDPRCWDVNHLESLLSWWRRYAGRRAAA